jgi:drug/metabolite transporter (DMT)-like permease
MEQELITRHQANLLMVLVLVAAPLIGLVWGIRTKKVRQGVGIGAALGIGNMILWGIYNAITDRLGLDTVKNLLVNLGIFAFIGIVSGVAVARSRKEKI